MKTLKNVLTGMLSGGVTALIVAGLIFSYGPAFSQETDLEKKNSDVTPLNETSDSVITEEDFVVNAVSKASPAVVSVIITKDVPILEQYYENFGNGFFQIPSYRETGETEKQQVGGGSGFIVTPDGYIMTNKHVVSEEDADYTVFLNDSTEYSAEVIARDPLNDLAVLKIDAEDLPYLEFADSSDLKPGQSVIAIGNPLLEFSNSVSVGVVSGLLRSISAYDQLLGSTEELTGVIQTDAAINPGNSGGPLLNLDGEVVGVNVAVASGENLGFALPSNLAKGIVDSIKENGRIVRPYMGVRYAPVTAELKEANNLEVDYGVVVLKGATANDLAVIPGSPADKAGITENDIILEADGKKLDEENSLARIVAEKNVGDKIELKVLHDGEEKEVEVTLEEIPQS